MRAQKWKIAVVVAILGIGWTGWALGDVAATVDPGLITGTAFGPTTSIGWRFFVDKKMTVTHLGLYDADDAGLSASHVMGIWRVKKEGGLRLERWVNIGPGGVREEDGHVYVPLAEPFTIVPDPVAYYFPPPDNRGPFYERWLVGVYSPAGSLDLRSIDPPTAATLAIQNAGIIRFENYTYRTTDFEGTPDTALEDVVRDAQKWYPWGQTTTAYHFGVNFKYSVNQPPVAGNDNALTRLNTPVTVDVLANDSDPDVDDALSIGPYTQGVNGTVAPAEGGLMYTPSQDFVGNDTFTYTIKDGHEGTATATVFVSVAMVIDIKPGSYPNSINLGSHGVVPVAILSTTKFDATTLDPGVIFLEGATGSVAIRGKGNKYMSHVEDVNGDAIADLVVQFDTENLDPDAFQDGIATVTVGIAALPSYQGEDTIVIVPLAP